LTGGAAENLALRDLMHVRVVWVSASKRRWILLL